MRALSVLQDRLPPFESKLAYEVIEAELKRPVSEIYSQLTPEPVAAASLGQVLLLLSASISLHYQITTSIEQAELISNSMNGYPG